MHINCTVRTLMGPCTQVYSTGYKSTALQMNSISAQIVTCTHKNFSSLSSPIESAGSLYTAFLHLFYRTVKKIKYTCASK